jgi:hypothetical protein
MTELTDCFKWHVLAVGAAHGKVQCVLPLGRGYGNADASDLACPFNVWNG